MDNYLPMILAPHPRGPAGAKKSLEKVVEFISRDRLDPRTQEWTVKTLIKAGNPKSDYDKAKAIYDEIKRTKIYVLDPTDSEVMRSAVCTLYGCGGLVIDGGDCDDLTISFVSAIESVGLFGAVVGQSFDNDLEIKHVLGAFWDNDSQSWIKVDCSIDLPFGQTYNPTREIWLSVPGAQTMCDNTPFCNASQIKNVDFAVTRPKGDFVGIVPYDKLSYWTQIPRISNNNITIKQWSIFGIAAALSATITTISLINISKR